MTELRHFRPEDAEIVRRSLYPDADDAEAAGLIDEWNAGVWQGKPFEMLAVLSGGRIVGQASLLEHSPSVVSAGIEISAAERNRGLGTGALAALISLAKEKGYRIMLDQVRWDNRASIRLHEKLGFESDGCVYRNRQDREVILFIKPL